MANIIGVFYVLHKILLYPTDPKIDDRASVRALKREQNMTRDPVIKDDPQELADELAAMLLDMEEAIRSAIPGSGALINMTEPGSEERQELLQDLMRGSSAVFSTKAIFDLLENLGGWDLKNKTEQDTASIGDTVCEVDISGQTWPCVIFSAMATPFDDDPLLTCMTGHLRSRKERFCLLHPHPVFQVQTDREGQITHFVLFGGWLIDDDTCLPFCIEPDGTENLFEQTKFFRTPRVSRGFFRDRGFKGDQISFVVDTQIELDKSMAQHNSLIAKSLGSFGTPSGAKGGDKFSRENYTLATGMHEWSYFMSREMAEQLQELQNMMSNSDFI